MDKPGTAGTLLRERLPSEVVAILSDEPPELMPGSFVSRRLRGYRTDRLYRSRTITGRPVLIYTLIEAKSRPEPRIGLHLLGYQYQALDHWDKTEGRAPDGALRPLPLLVTMVVYSGAPPRGPCRCRSPRQPRPRAPYGPIFLISVTASSISAASRMVICRTNENCALVF